MTEGVAELGHFRRVSGLELHRFSFADGDDNYLNRAVSRANLVPHGFERCDAALSHGKNKES
jgi:hypothetical protein